MKAALLVLARGGAMTDKAWSQVCALARQPRIAGIKPMRFE